MEFPVLATGVHYKFSADIGAHMTMGYDCNVA